MNTVLSTAQAPSPEFSFQLPSVLDLMAEMSEGEKVSPFVLAVPPHWKEAPKDQSSVEVAICLLPTTIVQISTRTLCPGLDRDLPL